MNPQVAEKKPNGEVVIDIDDDGDRSRNRGSSHGRKRCRICQEYSEISPFFTLGCDCKGGVGCIHENCAKEWFSVKGNNVCEVCGKLAKNMTGYINNDNNIILNNDNTIILNTINISSNNNNNNNDDDARQITPEMICWKCFEAILLIGLMFIVWLLFHHLWLNIHVQ